jgi:hypothetical protein
MDNIREKIENKVIDLIALGATGRLIVYKPENSDKDLVVEKKGGYGNKKVYLNIYVKELFDDIKFNKKVIAKENFYLVFVNFDIVKQELDNDILVITDKSNLKVNKKDFVSFLINIFGNK